MIPRPRFTRGLSGLVLFGLLLALSASIPPAAAQAQDKQFALRFSSKSGDPTPRASLPLRPNLLQDFFIYVDNLNAQTTTLKVEVRAGGKPIEGGVATVAIQPKQKITQVSFGKPPQAGDKPPMPPPSPTPPVLAEIKGVLKVMLFDMANKVIDEVTLNVAQPKEYVEVTKISFNPKPGGDKKNQLRVELKAIADRFAGPRCRVDLVLDSSRIPGLIEAKKYGSRGGFLAQAGAELVLTADNLEFKDNNVENGFVCLTIDGYDRAYTFSTTFPREGTESSPEAVNTPIVRLSAPREANPAKPLSVLVQADNLGPQVIELGFDRDGDGKFSKLNGEIQTFPGNRRLRMLFNPIYPGGALQLKPELKDWTTNLEVAEVFGPRWLRGRLLKNAAEALKPQDEDRAVDLNLNKAFGGKEPLTQILQTVVLDGSPPEGVHFVDMPKKQVRGEPLPVSAVGIDPESGIKEVLFFVGKPGPDGKPLPNAIQATGKLIDKSKGQWSALLDAPTDQKGKLDISVQFVNFANMVTTDSIKIEFVDPGKDANAGGKGSIAGKITDIGGLPQGKGVPVELRDDKGVVKDSTKTDEMSAYLFKDVAPGTYTVAAKRTGNNTKGATTVQVKEGDKKTDVDVKLSR